MNQERKHIIAASMQPRAMHSWTPAKVARKAGSSKKLVYMTAAIIGLSVVTAVAFQSTPESIDVMSHLETGFEYDETLGRLQYVSNMLPESAMVFLSGEDAEMTFTRPADAEIIHAWNQSEPWIEYDRGEVMSACQSGEVMTIVQNRAGEYTIRLLHDNGYESIYTGLTDVLFEESDSVDAGEMIGYSTGIVGFELRKDGLSVMPDFSSL